MSKFKIGDYARITNPLDPNFDEIGVVGNSTGPFFSPAIHIIEMRLRSGLFSISEQELTLSTQAEYWAQIIKFNPGFTITPGSVNTGSTPQAFQVGDRVEVINTKSFAYGYGGKIIQIINRNYIIVNIDTNPSNRLVAKRTYHYSETDLIKVSIPTYNTSSSGTSSSGTSNTSTFTFTSPDNTQVVFPDRIVFTINSVQKCICNMRDLMMNGCESTHGMKCNSVK